MKRNSLFRITGTRPSIVGAGLIALDVVYSEDFVDPVGRWAGGTCGNVLSILSWLGWSASPVARLKPGSESTIVRKDLTKWGVTLDFVTDGDTGSTPIILQFIRRDEHGDVYHRFKMRCPICGSRLPSFRPVTGNAVTEMLPHLPDADVFFFDRTSRGILDLAAHYHESGAVIVFEPSGIGEHSHFCEAVEMAHVVKVSDDRLKASDVKLPNKYPSLYIETKGRSGMRYRCRFERYRTTTWQTLSAFALPSVRDSAGAGDWCVAGLIYKLAQGGIEHFKGRSKGEVVSALQLGQAMSAWNCRFEGARGGMYCKSLPEFATDVASILDGDVSNPVIPAYPSATFSDFACDGCRTK